MKELFNQFSQNLTSQEIKENNIKETYQTIDNDIHIKIIKPSIFYFLIEKDSNLLLDIENIENLENNQVYIKILVKEKVNFNLINLNYGDNLKTDIEIIQEDYSNVKHLVFNIGIKENINYSNINLNSNYNVEGINCSYSDDLLNYNTLLHTQNNSKSNAKFNCYTINKSNIICKTKSNVKQKLKNIESHQISHGLILEKDSKINCEPILEILSNDVISSHSASVSKIFDDQLYYLMSRGFKQEDIKKFIVKERFNYLIEKIDNEEFKNIVYEEIENN